MKNEKLKIKNMNTEPVEVWNWWFDISINSMRRLLTNQIEDFSLFTITGFPSVLVRVRWTQTMPENFPAQIPVSLCVE